MPDEKNLSLSFSKDKLDELVIRKALYQLTPYCEWELEETGTSWIVTAYSEKKDIKRVFDRLINDQVLRSKIDRETYQLRRKIIYKALSDIGGGA